MKTTTLHNSFPKYLMLWVWLFLAMNVKAQQISFDFYTGTFNTRIDSSLYIATSQAVSSGEVSAFYEKMNKSRYQPLIQSLLSYRDKYRLDDWLYYQLIRHMAQQLSPKGQNYHQYTLYKWFLLNKSGYDARVAIGKGQIIFYVRNDEDISDVPFFMIDHKKFICLNYHDYKTLFEITDAYRPVNLYIPEGKKAFSYRINQMPDFKYSAYEEKEVSFSYRHRIYHFPIKVNREIESIFANYPGVDFGTYFNIPLSRNTYQSLIPLLRANLKGMNQKKGIDYLMRFTRFAFLYENDGENFGREKRLSPEQTLINQYSDCDDRAALFFYLVKEIYNLPMIALLYPTHVTMAIQLEKPVGKNPILYKGRQYTICEPTPQVQNLRIGELSAGLKNKPYEIVYAYEP